MALHLLDYPMMVYRNLFKRFYTFLKFQRTLRILTLSSLERSLSRSTLLMKNQRKGLPKVWATPEPQTFPGIKTRTPLICRTKTNLRAKASTCPNSGYNSHLIWNSEFLILLRGVSSSSKWILDPERIITTINPTTNLTTKMFLRESQSSSLRVITRKNVILKTSMNRAKTSRWRTDRTKIKVNLWSRTLSKELRNPRRKRNFKNQGLEPSFHFIWRCTWTIREGKNILIPMKSSISESSWDSQMRYLKELLNSMISRETLHISMFKSSTRDSKRDILKLQYSL